MTWTDSHWVLIYSISDDLDHVILDIRSGVKDGPRLHGCINGTPAGSLLR